MRKLSNSEYRRLLRGASPAFRRFLVFSQLSKIPPTRARLIKWNDVRMESGEVLLERRRYVLSDVPLRLLRWIKANQSPKPDPGLSARASRLLRLLRWYHKRDCTVWPSQRELARHLGVNAVKTIQRGLRELEAAGRLVTRKSGSQRPNEYFLVGPCACEAPKVAHEPDDQLIFRNWWGKPWSFQTVYRRRLKQEKKDGLKEAPPDVLEVETPEKRRADRRYLAPNAGQLEDNPTVAEVIAWHNASLLRDYHPKSIREMRRLWCLFAETYGAKRISECRTDDLLQFILSFKAAKSNHTRRRVRAVINLVFNAATVAGVTNRNPFRGIKLPEGKRGRDWTKAEFQAALRYSPPHLRRLLMFLRFSGARPGEARGLQWDQVDFVKRVCVMKDHKTAHVNHGPRRIYFNDVVEKLLKFLRRRRDHRVYVFTNHHKRPWKANVLVNRWVTVRRRAGLGLDVKLHGGRHSFATTAIERGVDVAILAQLMGHRDLATTSIYLHLADRSDFLCKQANKAIGHGGTPPPA